MPRRKTRKGGGPGNVNPSITEELRVIVRAIDDILAIPAVIMNDEVRQSFVSVKRLTVHMIRSNDTYPLPILVTYHDSGIRILRTIRDEIDYLLESEDPEGLLDDRVSTIMRCLNRLKSQLPRSQTRTRPRSRSRSRNRQV